MHKKKSMKGHGMLQRLTDILDIPSSVLPWGMDIEIRNDHDVLIDGCTGITEYTAERVVFKGKGMSVTVEGEDFELYTFADGRVRVSGKVSGLMLYRGDFDD